MRRRTILIIALLTAVAAASPGWAAVAAANEFDAAPAAAAEPAPSPAAAPALGLGAAPATVTAGDATRLTVRLSGIPGAPLLLSRRVEGTTDFRVIGQLVTDASGLAGFRALPRATSTYRVDYAGDGVQWLPATAEVTVAVRPRVKLLAAARVYRGQRARLSVAVGPRHSGATVVVERRTEGAWAEWRTLQLGSDSRAAFTWRPDKAGAWPLRVVVPADDAHLEGRSPVCKIRVVEPNPYDVPLDAKGIIVVDISQYRLHFFSYGRELRSFPCVTGRPSLPTPLGRFKVYARGMWPGGPYGARIMSYHPPCAIHGTNEPGLLRRFPRNFSHGCTRLANANAVWLYDHAPLGTPVWNVP
jgi:lipoprotein-anchoring transpeptidase ErfK/SrfK